MRRSIAVSLTEAEAEALLAFTPDGEKAYAVDPVVLLHARGKLIGKLSDRRDYLPPTHRSRTAASAR